MDAPATPAATDPYNVGAALKAGYTPTEVTDYLGAKGVNVGDARTAGYSDGEIASYLSSLPAPAAAPPPQASSATGALARAAAEQVLPTAGGMAAAGMGAATGAALGAAIPIAGETGIPEAIGAVGGGLLGFYGGAKAVEDVQQAIIDRLPTKVQQAIGQSPEQRQADVAQHPYAAMAGGLAPSLLFLRPGAVEQAAENAPAVAKFMANPIAARAFGAGVNTATEAVQEEQEGQGYDPVKLGISAGFGALLNRETALGRAVTGAGPAAIGRVFSRPAVRDVLDADNVDDAINAANAVASSNAPIDVAAHAATLDAGDGIDQQQAKLLRMFDNAGLGTVEQAPDGSYALRSTDAAGTLAAAPIKVWDPDSGQGSAVSGQDTIPPDTAQAIRDHYAAAGVDTVFYQDHPSLAFDGSMDPAQPDTIFLSNNPQRAVAQVAGHEFTHVLAATTLPDGSSLGDLLNRQIAASITPAGQAYAEATFGVTAPKREALPPGPLFDAAHAASVQAHLVNELGADIGAEAPRFQSFLPRVVDAVQARFGNSVAGNVLAKLIGGLQKAVDTIRGLFPGAAPGEPGRELFGDTGTQSQNWVTNINDIHDTLARMYAERFGSPIERQQAAADALRDQAARDAFTASAASAGRLDAVLRPIGAPLLRQFATTIAAQRDRIAALHLDTALRPIGAAKLREWLATLTGEGPEAPAAPATPPEGPQVAAVHARLDAALRPLGGPTLRRWLGTLAAEHTQRGAVPPATAADRLDAALRPVDRLTLRRWLAGLTAERDQAAGASPQATVLHQTEAAILRPVQGDEGRLAAAQATRLAAVRARLAGVLRARGDTPAMAAVRDEIEATQPAPRVRKPRATPAPAESEPPAVAPTSEAPAEPVAPTPETSAPPAAALDPDGQMAEAISSKLDAYLAGHGELGMSARELQQLADQAYGGTLASGAYTRDRLYDAIELGINRFIQKHPNEFSTNVDADRAKEIATALAALKSEIPTQTVRAGEKDAYQQFSTPPDYAYAAAWAAHISPRDSVLEPSAGTGSLAVHAQNAGAEVTANELSAKRRNMLAVLAPTRITAEDAAQLNNILPANIKPTVVLMNPPFSRAAERMGNRMVLDEGFRHVEHALARLQPGGRLVAIVGDTLGPRGPRGGAVPETSRAFSDWWARTAAQYDARADIRVGRAIYQKYGTSFPTRLLVIDKQPPSGRATVTGNAETAAELIDRLRDVRDDRSTIEPVAGQPTGPAMAPEGAGGRATERELPGATGVVGPGERGNGAVPAQSEPAGTGEPGVGTGRAPGQRPGAGRRGNQMVPGEPEPGPLGAGAEPGAAAPGGEEPGGGGAGGAGDGIRPDGSGERVEPGVTEAPQTLIQTEGAVSDPADRGITEAVYEPYRPQRIKVEGAQPHPGALVQSAAMAAAMPPATNYQPRLPRTVITSGLLSDAQLEAVVYAGHAHSDMLPGDGGRRGFFIGDGTGVGKGREIAGIILDNFSSGRSKAVWISEKRALINDAKRDWSGLGQPADAVIDHGKLKPGDPIAAKRGILFTSYDTLKSAEQTKTEGTKVRGKERVDQIVDWLGKDFDGVIAFDESHNLANSVAEKGKRGVKTAAQKALAGVALQDKLPNARVVYVSATGATEVGNLAYAKRLGLWGEGTAFPTRDDFVGQIGSGGMAAMELVARDMKAMGNYIARNLSYDGVDYDRLEHVLTPDQRGLYDKMAEGWQVVLQHFNAALKATSGDVVDGRRKGAILAQFWGGHQRFFNQIITAMQMPSVIRSVQRDVAEGRQAVLQLVNTMEAAQERALEKARASGDGELEDLDMTPRDQLMTMVRDAYPIQQYEDYVLPGENIVRSRPVTDSDGKPVINPEMVARRDRLLNELGSLRVPDGPLELLINHFGTDAVAEVTGRKQRVVRKLDETGQMKRMEEKRGGAANIAETNAFQGGKKPILVFSEAGGTGRSYHAAIGSGSEGARRSHYLVQAGWRADKAVQGFGRTHRTNQASAPIFHLVTTDLQGQKRFISSIARRLGQLGALTKGERRAADQGLFSMRDNLESTEARAALRQFFQDVNRGEVADVGMDDLERGMGLKMRDPQTGGLRADLPEMSTFLNRVLSLTIDRQNRTFQAFSDRFDAVIDRAAASGTLDTGVETYQADKIAKASEQTVYTEPRSGAETKHVRLEVYNRNHPASFEDTLAGRNKTGGERPGVFVQNKRSGNVFAVSPATSYTDAEGRIVDQVRLTSPTDYQYVDKAKVDAGNWTRLAPGDAKPLWDAQVANTPEFHKSDLHLITGAILPIWDRIGGEPKIYRLQTEAGERMLGRVVPNSIVADTLKRLGVGMAKATISPAELVGRIMGGDTAQLANEWRIKPSLVAGERRMELVGPDYRYGDELARHGVFSERIGFQTRYFIPTGKDAAEAIAGITANRPVVRVGDDEVTLSRPGAAAGGEVPGTAGAARGVQFSPRITGADRETEAYTPEQLAAYTRVGRVTDEPGWRQRLATATEDLGRRALRYTLDPYIGVKRDDPAGYMALRNANTTAGASLMFLTDGTLKFDGSTYAMADRNGGVENNLVRPLHGEQDRFLWWVAAHRAERLAAEDRENLWSAQDIDAIKGTNRGGTAFDYTLPNGTVTRSREAIYADSLRKLDVFNRNVMDLAVDSGLLDRDRISPMLANPFYVPFYRQAEGDTHFVGPRVSPAFVKQYAFKQLTGGAEKLNHDLWQNAIGNWSHMIDAALRNRAAAGVLDTAVTNGAAREATVQEVEHQMTKRDRQDTAWVMKDGERQYYAIGDRMLYTAITALDFNGFNNPIMRAVGTFKKWLTIGVTSNPLFMLRVSIRDAEQAIATAPMTYNVLGNIATGFRMGDLPGALQDVARAVAGREMQGAHLSDRAADVVAGGGTMHLGSGLDTGQRKTDLATMLDTPTTIGAFWKRVSTIATAYHKLTALGEDVHRFALYDKLIAEGVPHDAATFAARDLEDFTLRGAGTIVRGLTQMVPFMNAWAQGLYKVGRSAADSDRNIGTAVGMRVASSATRRVITVLGATTLLTLALDALYQDDEDYKKRPEYDRNSNFWFKFGGVQFRIPMGFEVAALSRIAANGVEAFFDREMTARRFLNNVGSIFASNLSMNPTPQIIRPILDLAMNQSGTGTPITPEGLKDLRSEYQYNANSTLAARGISAVGNQAARAIGGPGARFLSPIQLDYLTNGYFGWLGSMITGTADRAAREFASVPARPALDIWNFATGGMVQTQPEAGSRYVDLLYQQADAINQAFATYHKLLNTGRAADAQQFLADNKALIARHSLVAEVSRFEATQSRIEARIENSPDMSREQKRVAIMKINAARNRMAERAVGGAHTP